MAQAIITTIERDLPDASAAYERAKSGKAMARELDKIDFAARCSNVTQPSSLLSESPAALVEQMRAQGMDPARMRLPPEQWFAASDGLNTIRALIDYVSSNMNKFKQPNPILRDLKAAEMLLAAADAAGVRFHFTRMEL